MRYELRLTAFDMLDQIHVSIALYQTLDHPGAPTELAWATTATARSKGTPGATTWIREALDTSLHAVPQDRRPPDATDGPLGGDSIP